MQHATSTFTGSDNIELFCQSWLPDAEPRAAIIIVHGVGEHSDRYANIVPHLVDCGYAVHSYDQRGHGRSPGKRGHIEGWHEYREDLHSFVQTIEQEKIFLFGHSMGGLVVLDYAIHYPETVRGVMVSSPALAIYGESILDLIVKPLNWLLPRVSLPSAVDSAGLSRIPEVVKAYKDDPLVHARVTPRWLYELMHTSHWVHKNGSRLKMPLMMTHGSADRVVPIEGTKSFFTSTGSMNKALFIYPDAFHEPHNDLIHEDVAHNIGDWVNERLTGKGMQVRGC